MSEQHLQINMREVRAGVYAIEFVVGPIRSMVLMATDQAESVFRRALNDIEQGRKRIVVAGAGDLPNGGRH